MTTRFIHLVSPKNGQGTSTTAVLLALGFVREGKNVLVVQDKDGDLDALFGVSTLNDSETIRVTDNITIAQTPFAFDRANNIYDVVITDKATIADEQYLNIPSETYAVVQPCYMALRKLTQKFSEGDVNGVIIVRPEGRVLTNRDVANTTGFPVVGVINMSNDISRASDAGLLTRKTEHALTLNLASA